MLTYSYEWKILMRVKFKTMIEQINKLCMTIFQSFRSMWKSLNFISWSKKMQYLLEDLKVNIYIVTFQINLKTIVYAWIFDSRLTFGIKFMLFKSCYF